MKRWAICLRRKSVFIGSFIVFLVVGVVQLIDGRHDFHAFLDVTVSFFICFEMLLYFGRFKVKVSLTILLSLFTPAELVDPSLLRRRHL